MDQLADLHTDRPGSLIPPFAVSLLVHALLALLFVSASLRMPAGDSSPFAVEILEPTEDARPSARTRPAHPETAPPAPKALVEPPKTQIVSPPDSPEQKSDHARLLSDRDSRTAQETIKQGAPAPAAKPPQETAESDDAQRSAKQQRATKAAGDSAGIKRGDVSGATAERATDAATRTAPLVGLSDLFIRPSELARDPALRRGESGTDEKTDAGGKRDLALLSHPELWEPAPRGSLDYLPGVRPGDVTLLNTKADRFAPFVRRVGMRVFQSFSMQFKQEIYAGRVPEGRDDVQVEAVMSRDGKRVEVSLKQHSGNLSADRTLLGTLNDQTFFDENPPADAVAADGRIHFVFALDALVSGARDPRRGRRPPGAQWVFGAGLL
jgi:hypothetical protein